MKKISTKSIKFVALTLIPLALGACGSQPSTVSTAEPHVIEFASSDFQLLSLDERLEVLAEYCPAGTKAWCNVRGNSEECSCIEDIQMRRNLERLWAQ